MRTKMLCALALAVAMGSCSKDDSKKSAPGASAPAASAATPTTGATKPAAAPAGGIDCSSPRKTIESQVAIIKKGGKAQDFAQCFTERLRGRITQKMLDKSHSGASAYVMDKLYGKEDKKSDTKVKVKMPNGRTLTTLVKVGDQWQADTLWFK